jgi:ATP-dependent RNA helicase DeaD
VQAWVDEGYDLLLVAAAALKLARAEEKQRPIAPLGELKPTAAVVGERRRTPRDVQVTTTGKDGQHGRDYKKQGQRPAPISHEAGMVRLRLSAGRTHGVRPGDVVRSIASTSNIPGRSLGAIEILSQETYVDVPEKLVGKVLQQSGKYQIFDQLVKVEKAE